MVANNTGVKINSKTFRLLFVVLIISVMFIPLTTNVFAFASCSDTFDPDLGTIAPNGYCGECNCDLSINEDCNSCSRDCGACLASQPNSYSRLNVKINVKNNELWDFFGTN